MPYTNCSVCGAKALVGATRCPRCQAPFVSYDPKGERVETVTCPNCGVQRPVAIGVCPNCLTSTAPAGARLARGLALIGIGIAVILGVGYVIAQRFGHTPAPVAAAAPTDTTPVPADSAVSDSAAYRNELAAAPVAPPPTTAPTTAPAPATNTATAPAAKPPVDPQMVPPKPAPLPKVAVADTGAWEYAVALTWVRVRSAPSRDSDVLRMVDSAQRVRLGPPQSGWRPVRVGVDRGWVDPRLFTVVGPPKP